MIHNFKADRPYQVIEIWDDGIKYKIMQPFKFLFFGYSNSYFDVTMQKAYSPDETICFDNKDSVDQFIKKETEKFNHKEVVVYDSQKTNTK